MPTVIVVKKIIILFLFQQKYTVGNLQINWNLRTFNLSWFYTTIKSPYLNSREKILILYLIAIKQELDKKKYLISWNIITKNTRATTNGPLQVCY